MMRSRQHHTYPDKSPDAIYSYLPPLPDYTAAAILAFFLFFLCYFPGLIYTIFKLVDALQFSDYYKQLYGRRPEGIGCLQILLIVGLLGPVVAVGFVFFGLYSAFPHR